ncbi:AI-2E family transporter [Frigidibacter sp. MR17.14]|uniref:AI-2E family transporter n=1 Tax=Frigidibacter sp. MR17.14 TaxID=3126509 RepID=UPI003012F16E
MPADAQTNVDDPLQQPKVRLGPRWAVIGLFLIAAFGSIAHARDFLMPLSMSVLLFFVFAPLRRKAERLGIPSAATATLVIAGLVAILVMIAVALSGPASNMASGAPQIAERLEVKFQGLSKQLEKFRDMQEKIDNAAKGEAPPPPPDVASSLPAEAKGEPAPAPDAKAGEEPPPDERSARERRADNAKQTMNDLVPVDSTNILLMVLSSTPALAGQLMFVLLLLFFLLASGDLLYLKIVQSFDMMGEKRRAYSALREIEASLGSYLGTITIINAGLGVAIGTAMWLWGMPAPIVIGIAAFLLNYIPYIGLGAGAVVATIIALVSMPGFVTPLMVGGTYVLLSSIEGQLVTPYFVSRRLEMNTVVVFITIALWAWLWSVAGMIVAVPMLVVMRVLCDHIPGLERLGNFLGGEKPAPLGPEGDEVRGDDGQRETGDEKAPNGRLAV